MGGCDVKSCEERNLSMVKEAENLGEYWRQRLIEECPEKSEFVTKAIISWLLGLDLDRYEVLKPRELEIAKQAMEYRWRILRQRYLGVGPQKAYCNLINRLGYLVTLRNKIRTWIALSRDRQRTVTEVLQEILQELMQTDAYIQQQMASIAEITTDRRLQDTLLFATLEEYCLRPVRNQPLLLCRFVNHLRRAQRGGVTQVPAGDLIKLISEEILTDDSESRINLVDSRAITEYQEAQKLEEQQILRQTVQQQLEQYLLQNLGPEAVQWLQMYLQGKSQEEIANKLNKPTKEVYRLREKISYHAVRVFALKNQQELVDDWLSTSVQEHNLGLTETQWQQLQKRLTLLEQQILDLRQAGNSIEIIVQQLQVKTHQVIGGWTKVWLAAQNLRNQI